MPARKPTHASVWLADHLDLPENNLSGIPHIGQEHSHCRDHPQSVQTREMKSIRSIRCHHIRSRGLRATCEILLRMWSALIANTSNIPGVRSPTEAI